MSLKTTFRIISVAGAHSMVGKTTLCSVLIKELKGYGAIKFTKDLFGSSLIDDEKMILQEGKDTAIMASSGAEKVLLISGHGERLMDAIKKAIMMMKPFKGVIIEGNAPIEFLVPDLLIFVIGDDRQIKPQALKIARSADIVVVNSRRIERDSSFLSDILKKEAKIFFINLMRNEGEIKEFLSYVKRRLPEI